MHAATQQHLGTMQPARGGVALPWLQPVPSQKGAPRGHPMTSSSNQPRQYYIHGTTNAGKVFRPSDWAERLAGAMSSFRPGSRGGAGGIGAFIGYSPYCVPQVIDEVRCVLVNEALRDIEPMAWEFVMNFARDNDLPVSEVCLLPAAPQPKR
jgi:hypothetical protein